MSHLLFWPTVTFFYPIGNTSAVCLTENLPPESKADVLLIACGDPRHILYTIYANETNPLTCLRTFDVTCCDVDPAVLARNALLFTLLADDGALGKLDNLWNLFYHMSVDQTTLSILSKQCRKLVALAESPETWRAGPYGHFLTACDARTLSELRRIWTSYLAMTAVASNRETQFKQRFISGRNEMSRMMGHGGTTAAVRSAGPFLPYAQEAISRQFSSYWTCGTTDAPDRSQNLKVNPTFALSLDGDKFSVHYGTDPLSGFHLAEAFSSGRFTSPGELISPHELVRIAKEQFSRWCTSISKRLQVSNSSSQTFVIRMFAGDALSFCQALKYCEVMHSPVTPYNVAAWRLSTITFDHHYYGDNAPSPAPLSFNVIDTSNILDHLGFVNLLVVTAPLLQKSPSARLYTEALLRMGNNLSQTALAHICGDLSTMSLLLGVIPSSLLSHFSTRSNAHENLATGPGARQHYERLAWQATGFGGPGLQHSSGSIAAPSQPIFFPPRSLAKLLFSIYVQMFSHEDMRSRFKELLSVSGEHMVQMLRQSANLHYNRRSFALLVHFIKTRIQTDWTRTMDLFERMVMTDRRLLTGQQAYQELCCHFHMLGVYTTEWISAPALQRQYLEYEANLGPFRDWVQSSIPQVVTLVLVVPRDSIGRLERDFKDVGTPILQCQMDDGPRQNWFAVISATFGTLRVSGTGGRRTGIIVEGNANTGTGASVPSSSTQPLWRNGAPLIVTFSVPSASVMDFGRNPDATVGLGLRATPAVSAMLTSRLGFDLMVYRTKLTDKKRVFILAQAPVVGGGANTSTSGSGGVSAVIAGEEAIYSEKATTNPVGMDTDVEVQMNNASCAVQSLTVRIAVRDPRIQAAFANAHSIPTLASREGSICTPDVRLNMDPYTLSFYYPLPVNMSRAKVWFARWTSYIKIIAPLAPVDVRPERNISSRFAPSALNGTDGIPTLGSIHYLNLNQCPPFHFLQRGSQFNWCDTHLSYMLSALEATRWRPRQTEPTEVGNSSFTPIPDTLLRVKQTLHLLLRTALGATSGGKAPVEVFALCDTSPDARPYLYIITACVRLDIGSHTVVADAFVAPGTPVVHEMVDMALFIASEAAREKRVIAIRYLATGADETAAWFHLLPRLTERCRTWSHTMNCAYRSQEQQLHPEEPTQNWGAQSPLCTCGAGVGTESLPEAFRGVAPYLTRAAFSPLFPVSYLKEVNVPLESEPPSFSIAKSTFWLGIACVCIYVCFFRK